MYRRIGRFRPARQGWRDGGLQFHVAADKLIGEALLHQALLLLLWFCVADAAPGDQGDRDTEVQAASERLSRYPAGQVPVEPSTMRAIAVLAERGSRNDVGVLRSLVAHERSEVRDEAVRAIEQVRERQRNEQRSAYASALLEPRQLERAAVPWRRQGFAETSARLAAYATWVLGEERAEGLGSGDGDARYLLATGQPRKALAVLAAEGQSSDALKLVARAREDAGDVRGALQTYTLAALAGDLSAEGELAAFGVDPEQLFLGLLVVETSGPVGEQEAPLLEALVRRGTTATVKILAERMFRGGGSEQVSAADALVRMLERSDLEPVVRQQVLSALIRAAEEGAAPVREIASAAL